MSIPRTTEYGFRPGFLASLIQKPSDQDKLDLRKNANLKRTNRQCDKCGDQSDCQGKLSMSKAEERACQVFQEAFGENSPLPPILKQIIGGYIPEETTFFAHRTLPFRHLFIQPFDRFVDLSDRETLKCYFGTNCQTPEHLQSALKVIKRTYETASRYLVGNQVFGSVFATNPEVMAYAMELMKKDSQEQMGKVALEIGAASGENSIILAFSDAEKVYVNEINPNEIQQFETLKRDLPKGVKKKLDGIEGSCFDLLRINPKLKNKIDLILCRNVIHFFNSKQQTDFFQLIHSLLKPGGRGIFTVNSTFAFEGHPAIKKTFKNNPDQACFTHLCCFIYDFRVSNSSDACIYFGVTPRTEETFSLNNDKYYLYNRSQETQFKWKVYKDNFYKLDSAVRSKVKSAIDKNKEEIRSIKEGSVEMSINSVYIYSEKTLKRLFRNNGLEVESLFDVNELGHLVNDNEACLKGSQIGIICKKP